jgi:luciferase family oxidoreductase group 1
VSARALSFGVLDQSPIRAGATAADAVRETIELARHCDRLGYTRYWLAEHHNSRGLAGSAPEVLIARVAAETKHLRVGSGGVMLNHYSPLKVAETFRVLEALYPGRIDLGLGRAPGSDGKTAMALQLSQDAPGSDAFAPKLATLLAFYGEGFPPDHPFASIKVQPESAHDPEIWLLGSSDYSAAYAAHLGLPFSFAQFITGRGGDAITHMYRQRFQPSARWPKPFASIAVFVLVADSEEEARRLAASRKLWMLNFFLGREAPYPSVEEALAYPYSEREEELIRRSGRRNVIGTPDAVKAELLEMAATYDVEEIVAVSICHDVKARLRSYELLAECFGLPRRD